MSAVGRLASSRSRTTTPTRASTSTLFSRISPSVPAASHTFEPLVKAVLRHRLLYNIFAYSFIFSWIQTTLWLTWSEGGIGSLGIGGILVAPIMPLTVVLSCLNWTIGALPAIILRKVELTANRTSASSPSKILHTAISRRSTLRAVATYTLSTVLIMVVHIWMASNFDTSNPRLTVFVRSKKHPYYLNGRFLFILLSQVMASYGFLLRNILLDRFVFRWSTASSSSVRKWPFQIPDLIKASLTVALFTSICVCVSGFVFAGIRVMLPLLFKLPMLPYLLRPFSTHFLNGSWTIFLPMLHFSLVIRTFFLSLTILSTLEFAELLFDSFVTQPILVAKTTADPFLTLISGATSSDVIFKYFAYAELSKLAQDQSAAESARRTALFGDTKYTPNLWSHLVRESLLFLGRDYQLFLGRGQLKSPTAAAPVAAPSPGTPTHLIKKPIFKPVQPSPIAKVLQSFAADGSFSQAVDAGVDATHIPEIFRSVEGVLRPVAAASETAVVPKQGGGLIAQMKDRGKGIFGDLTTRYMPVWALEGSGGWTTWWKQERINKNVDACLPRREVDVLVVEVISHLTCASLTEDRYGAVQRDIPQILEAFLSFLSAVEVHQVEINALYTPPPPDKQLSPKEIEETERLRIEVEKAGEILGQIEEALKEGVARIVRTFGDKLLAFKFPPRIARKLQGFVDYS